MFSSSEAQTPQQAIEPRVVQGGDAPVFQGDGQQEFLCDQCGNLLILGYEPRKLISINIQCAKCGSITRTADWPEGEPLPRPIVTLGNGGAFLLGSTVDLRGRDAAFCCDSEILRVKNATEIRAPSTQGIDLTPEGMANLEKRLNEICGDFDSCLRKTRNAIARGNDHFLKFPPAWALLRLKSSLEAGMLNGNSADGVALTYIQTLLHTTERWQHIKSFSDFSKAFLFDFHHSVAQLVIASFLADAGNPIGFAEPVKNVGRTADMFINLGPGSKVRIEVKAAQDLQWPKEAPSPDRLRRIVQDKLRETRGQITQEEGGILVLGSSMSDPKFSETLKVVLDSMVASEEIPSRIAAVGSVNLAPHPLFQPEREHLRVQSMADVFAKPNPRSPKFHLLNVA